MAEASRSRRSKGISREKRSHWWGYFFIFPNLVITFIFFLYPLFETFRLSFYRVGLAVAEFVGWDNYIYIFQEKLLLNSISNTFLFVIIIVPLVAVISLVLAGLMQGTNDTMKAMYRLLFYLPAVCTPVVLTMVWSWMYSMNNGVLNDLLKRFGVQPIEWLGSPSMAMMSICVVVMTWSIGEPIILYLISMDSVSKEYYDAAAIDGASPVQQFVHITLPAVANTSLFVILTTTIAVFQSFVVIQLLTGGGPYYSTETLMFTIYRTAFTSIEFGLAAAQSVILFLIIMMIALIQLKFFKSKT